MHVIVQFASKMKNLAYMYEPALFCKISKKIKNFDNTLTTLKCHK